MFENEQNREVIVELDVGNLCVSKVEELKSSLEKYDFSKAFRFLFNFTYLISLFML